MPCLYFHFKNLYKRSVPACALLLSIFFPAAARSERYTFSAYGEDSGLSNLNATTLLQDHAGLVWVGTQSGVFTADGEHFQKQKAFTEAGLESIRALREDAAGRIWALDGRHLVYWQNGAVHIIGGLQMHIFNHEAADLVILPHVANSVFLFKAGELLVISSKDDGHSWQIVRAINQHLVDSHPALRNITSVAADGGSVLWLGCQRSLCRMDVQQQSVTIFGQEQGVAPDAWKSIMVARSGDVWARGEHSVVEHGVKSAGFKSLRNLPASTFQNVRTPTMVEDPSGKVVLNLSNGLAFGDADGWHVLDSQNGLPGDEIDTLMFDHCGAFWITSLGHGILRWNGYGNWEGWTKEDGLNSNIVWSASRDQTGKLWITTDVGLNTLDLKSGRITPPKSPALRMVAVVVDQRNHVWSADATGQVRELDPGSGRIRMAASGLDRVFQMHLDKEQRIWICSRKGLFFFSRMDGWSKPHPVNENAIPAGYAWSIAESPDGTIWVCTAKGLFRLKGDSWSHIQLPFPADFNFMIAAAPDGTLWVQNKLPSPILHLQVAGGSATVMDQVSGSILGSDNITFVDVDHRGWLWVGSDDGVQVFDGKRWVQCVQEDGLLWDDTDFHGFFADQDGSVWIGTSAGLSHLRHPERIFDIVPPRVNLSDLSLSGKSIDANSNEPFDLRRPTLSFRFLNVNYSRGSSVVDRYKLDGEENEWQEAESGLIRFPALDPGQYRLQVLTYDRRRHSSSAQETISFIVLQPWWKRPWFLLLEGVGAALILVGLWRLSVHILVARQQELERIVALRTIELETEKKELLSARSTLLEITRRDPLTGLLNRGAIFERMQSLCEAAVGGPPIAIIMADLDSFKRINDQHGHLTGDAVLIECAKRIGAVTRPTDAVGRYGGEELLILMPGLHPGSLKVRMEEVRMAIAGTPILHGALKLSVTCSFGVVWHEGDSCTMESLISLADAALYVAKQNGRNRVEYAGLLVA